MNSKLKNGYVTEQIFVVEAMERDVIVNKPITNTEIYDFIVDVKGTLYRVQVKKSWVDKKGRNITCLRSSYPRSSIRHSLTDSEYVDFLAVYCGEENNWYIIPIETIKHIKSNIAVRNIGPYAKYINNWSFLR
jgi:hypothetical protein